MSNHLTNYLTLDEHFSLRFAENRGQPLRGILVESTAGRMPLSINSTDYVKNGRFLAYFYYAGKTAWFISSCSSLASDLLGNTYIKKLSILLPLLK